MSTALMPLADLATSFDFITLYWICTVVGSTILVLQVLMLVFGFAADGHVDGGGGDAGGGDADVGTAGVPHGSDGDGAGADGHDMTLSAQVWSWLSFRGVTAFLAFFGLAGLAGNAANLTWHTTLPLGVMVGTIALVVVTMLMRSLNKLGASGNVSLANTVGLRGQVYVPPGPNKSLPGKVTVEVQGRTIEVEALCAHHNALKTGDPVVVLELVDANTVLVAPAAEGAPVAGPTGETVKPF